MKRERTIWTYKRINVYPASFNASGIRWNATINGQNLRSDTKQSMRQLITDYKGANR